VSYSLAPTLLLLLLVTRLSPGGYYSQLGDTERGSGAWAQKPLTRMVNYSSLRCVLMKMLLVVALTIDHPRIKQKRKFGMSTRMCLLGETPEPTVAPTAAASGGGDVRGAKGAASGAHCPNFAVDRSTRTCTLRHGLTLIRPTYGLPVPRSRDGNGTAGKYRNAHGQRWSRTDAGGR
jgi:hypothetical protein